MIGTLAHGALLAALILGGRLLSDPGAPGEDEAPAGADRGNPPAPASPQEHESGAGVDPEEAVAGEVDDEEEISDPDRYRKGPGW
jgi:hypothetical protein